METKHLEFIQAIIARLGNNSFQMKGWNVALATAAVGLAAAKDSRPTLAVLGVVPAMAFWFLDAYYLALERSYRCLYKKAVTGQPDFNLTADPIRFSDWVSSAARPSVFGLHVPMIMVVLSVSVTGIFR